MGIDYPMRGRVPSCHQERALSREQWEVKRAAFSTQERVLSGSGRYQQWLLQLLNVSLQDYRLCGHSWLIVFLQGRS